MIVLMYIQDLTTIGLVVSEIMCLIKIRTDGRQTAIQSDRQTEMKDIFLRTLGVMKGREHIKLGSMRVDSATILP